MVGGLVAYPTVTHELCCRYDQVTIPDPTDCIILQGRALVRAVESSGMSRSSTASPGIPIVTQRGDYVSGRNR